MISIRVHGRGGEGAVTFAHILCASATYDGKYGQSCMAPAIERRGAPVEAFGRIGDKPIAERGAVLTPDLVVVLNPLLSKTVNVEAGMKDSARLVVNSAVDLGLKHKAVYLDATSLATKILRMPITNTVMLGAFAAATELITLPSLENGARLLLARFSDEKMKQNLEAIKAGYEEVKLGKGIH